jgi:L-fuculose-phosphate aldolase
MTPANVSKGFMTPDMMVVTDLEGTLISGAPGRKPSSEILMHLVAYRERPDVNAVVHRTRRSRPDSRWRASRSIARSSPRS